MGPISQRAYERPRGYPGDYGIIEMFYDNKVNAKGLGVYWDRFVLDQDYVQAVRDRKDRMKEVLREFIVSSPEKSLSIFNLGSGSCRELRETSKDVMAKKTLFFSLLDQDQEALDFSKTQLASIHPTTHFNFIKDSVTNLAKNMTIFKNAMGLHNLVYSIGLADYIPDEFIIQLITCSLELLKPKGSFVLAHKNVFRHKSVASDWMSNWNFVPRDKKGLLKIIESRILLSRYKVSVEDIKEGHVFYVRLDKL